VALARLSLADYLASLGRVRAVQRMPPILIGHSMGGLLAQQLAASGPCAALVCLASAPPGVLPARFAALPYLVPLLPRILAGLTIHPSPATFRFLALHDLPGTEQDELVATLGAESGRAYRSMILGTARVQASAVRCPVLCVSGGRDRIIAPHVASAIAARYGAAHHVLESRGHWLLAKAGLEQVAKPVVEWLRREAVPVLSAV
jgi:pimeloyl-ACP methyl ester carboxylesterase